ncbi:hypothetical protein KCU81_g676, partial [Aureobasidium melanogenum]
MAHRRFLAEDLLPYTLVSRRVLFTVGISRLGIPRVEASAEDCEALRSQFCQCRPGAEHDELLPKHSLGKITLQRTAIFTTALKGILSRIFFAFRFEHPTGPDFRRVLQEQKQVLSSLKDTLINSGDLFGRSQVSPAASSSASRNQLGSRGERETAALVENSGQQLQ